MGRYEGVPLQGDDVDALIKLYRKYREIWEETYGKRVQKLIRAVVEILQEKRNLRKPKILILGAGTPVRFPKELDEHTTAVDWSGKVRELWKAEGRSVKFVTDDVENAVRDLGDAHDVIVLPAILSWLPENKRKRLSEELEKLHKKGKIIIAWETTHVRRGYSDNARFAEAFSVNWHKKYVGRDSARIALGVWVVRPFPFLSSAHMVDPGEEWFVEGSVRGLNEEEMKKLRENMRDVESKAAIEARSDPMLEHHIEIHHPQLIKRFKTSPT